MIDLSDNVFLREESENEDGTIELHYEVAGSAKSPYDVSLLLYSEDANYLTIEDYSCTCPAYESWDGMCKHCVAACLKYAEQLKTVEKNAKNIQKLRIERNTSPELESVIQMYTASDHNAEEGVAPGELHIQLSFKSYYSYSYYGRQICVEIKAGKDRLYVVKSIPQLIHSVLHGKEYRYGKNLSVHHSEELFDPISRKMLAILTDAVRGKKEKIDSGDIFFFGSDERVLQLNSSQFAGLLCLQNEAEGCITIDKHTYQYCESDPPIVLRLKKEESGGAVLTVSSIQRICSEPNAIYSMGQTAYRCSELFQKWVLPFLHGIGAVNAGADKQVFLSENDFSRFCVGVLPKLKAAMTVDEGDVDFEAFLPKEPEYQFYLSAAESGAVRLRAEVSYGQAAFPLEVVGHEYRNRQKEKPVIDLVSRLFPLAEPPEHRTTLTEDDAYRLLTEGLDELREAGEVYVDDSLKNLRWADYPKTSVGVALHGDLIDLEIDAAGYSAEDINSILDAYRLKKKYYRLKNGEFLSLTEGSLSVVAELSDGLDIRFNHEGKAQTAAFRASYINGVIQQENSGLDVVRNTDFKRLIRSIRDYRDSDYELPQELKANLRGYQRTGFRWLSTLSECGLGGILADDMGLGKTVQMLAYFLRLGGELLVVCPASLLYNWAAECEKFAPSIPCHVVRGTAEERRQILDQGDGLYVTSYDQLRRDIDAYQDRHFSCCVLDEAQYIRNAGTKAARAVKKLNADHRFALTATPIENRLSDLWSIFDFVMPGYLYRYTDFRTKIEQRAAEGDEKAAAQLGRMTAPFILRRKKQEVLSELPDKLENVVYVEMSGQQRALYDAQENALRHSLQKIGEAEFIHQKLEYLAALTRLRQICCTPELYLENYQGGSEKVDACIELVKESADGGHKTLVFSQFTSMLELLIARAETEGLTYLYLSGKNSSEQRRDMVQLFQSGKCDVFFISLKAGGTGLNLTAADRVIHFDPWWNVAAEEQATDRTHRIGQKNKVLVTKLVCKDSIEERILALQQRKRALSDMVVDREGLQSGTFDRDELLELLKGREIS